MSIVSLNQVHLALANTTLLDGVSLQIQPKERIALVGRNGAGKSTLLKLLQGTIAPDRGHVQYQSGIRVAGLTQEVPISADETPYHFLVKGLGEAGDVLAQYHDSVQTGDLEKMAYNQARIEALHAWDLLPKVETMASRLHIPTDGFMNRLSGGMRRRVLLGAALLAEAELLLLDEPTNHLDIDAIEWLESYIKNYPGSVLIVTHDRQFLSHVANRIVEIDRGQLHSHDCDYETYLDRREAMRLAEQQQANLFDKRLKEEEVWLRAGVKARRTRNEGRVRRLEAMRQDYRQRRNQLGHVKTLALDTTYSGKMVVEATNIGYQLENQVLLTDFSFVLTRGDKVGIIGPNGCGKTTLIRLLLGELQPTTGVVRQGTSLEVAYFDQLRRQIDEQETVMANVADGADYVTINGQQKHVASYLREFLFSPDRFNQPVHSLSGGERNRLLLAKLFAKPVNLLVMDEPTNDLDIETLELLESMLMDYSGTLLLISHDREFINHIVNSVLVHEGQGHFESFIGGYDDYRAHKKQLSSRVKPIVIKQPLPDAMMIKLTVDERRELNQLPKKIEQLEESIQSIHNDMADPAFYQQPATQIEKITSELNKNESLLRTWYARWEFLENKQAGLP